MLCPLTLIVAWVTSENGKLTKERQTHIAELGACAYSRILSAQTRFTAEFHAASVRHQPHYATSWGHAVLWDCDVVRTTPIFVTLFSGKWSWSNILFRATKWELLRHNTQKMYGMLQYILYFVEVHRAAGWSAMSVPIMCHLAHQLSSSLDTAVR